MLMCFLKENRELPLLKIDDLELVISHKGIGF